MMASPQEHFDRVPFFKRLWLRLRFSFYLPYIGAGICVDEVAPDFSRVKMRLKRHFFNQNYFGTHFGGSLYAMCNPVHVLLLIYHLGPDYIVIDQGAEIEFLKASRQTAVAEFLLTPQVVESIRKRVEAHQKTTEAFEIEVYAGSELIARVKKIIYIRRAGRLKNRRWG